MFIQAYFPKIKFQRRAISDVITTLLMVAITVIGGVMVWSLFSSSGVKDNLAVEPVQSSNVAAIKIVGYDTRDGQDLLGITTVDNSATTDRKLCTISCTSANTEHIVLLLRNEGAGSIYLDNIIVNDVAHGWVSSAPSAGGQYALYEVTFDRSSGSATQTTTATLLTTNEVGASLEVAVVIKLSTGIDPDIQLTTPIRISIFTANTVDPFEFNIRSGSAK
ncbi:MAG: archaellin/type IV pilin N-terminal domain-containing protein [Nitrosopumilaceae archaeon]